MQRELGIHQLNLDIMAEAVEDISKLFQSEPKDILEVNLIIGLSNTIIINTFGKEFWAKECTTFGKLQDFFKSKSSVRIVHLADMLWRLKGCGGFQEFIERNKQRHKEVDIQPAYYEAYAACCFLGRSKSVAFNKPINEPQSDFDIIVKDFDGIAKLNVEVKGFQVPITSKSNLKNRLNAAKGQWPHNQKGAIFCKLHLHSDHLTKVSI